MVNIGTTLTIVLLVGGVVSLDFIHHNKEKLEEFLQSVSQKYPHLTHLYSIGNSSAGADLWVIAIGYQPLEHIPLRPHVKYVGNMHGNEVVSRETLLHLVDHLVTQYGEDHELTSFLNQTVLHIMPTMNPDGYAKSIAICGGLIGRESLQQVDLNRNFPDVLLTKEMTHTPAVETQAVMDWIPQFNFVLSLNLHGGAKVVNYPYDQYTSTSSIRHGPSISPDDDIFRHLALVYSKSHANMFIEEGRECLGDYFPQGITNGAAWYPISGGMQDYNYISHGVFEELVEMACCKYPPASDLSIYWMENKNAFLNYAAEVHKGVKGIITRGAMPLVGVKLSIKGRETVPFWSKNHGEYFRVLMPGSYTLQVYSSKSGLVLKHQDFRVIEGEATVLNVNLLDIERGQQPNKNRATEGDIGNKGSGVSMTIWSYLPWLSFLCYSIYVKN